MFQIDERPVFFIPLFWIRLFFIFIMGALLTQKVNLVGELFVGEIIFSGVVLLKAIQGRLAIPREFRVALVLLFLWAGVQAVSDIVNEVELGVSIKGVFVPVLLGLTFLGVANFFNDRNSLMVFLLGVVWGYVSLPFTYGDPYFFGNPWKWGLGFAVIFTAVFFHRVSPIFRGMVFFVSLVFIIGISLQNSSRSLAGLFLISVLAFYFFRLVGRLPAYRRVMNDILLTSVFIIFMVFVLYVVDLMLRLLFTSDFLLNSVPLEDAEKYMMQANNEMGYILGGRSELLISIRAFWDSPLLGHGSWAESEYYLYEYIAEIVKNKYEDIDFLQVVNQTNSFLIPTHSYIMSSLVWGGAVAGLFWVYSFMGFLIGVLRGRRNSLIDYYLAVLMLWNILFSPFGANARWLFSIVFVLFFMASFMEGEVDEN